MYKKVFFIGLDSATWDLIKPWAKQGNLPTFKKLLNHGSCFDFESIIPPITAAAWPSQMTGVLPSKHGIYDFFKLDKDHRMTLVDSQDISQPWMWHILSENGYKSAIINIPMTYPSKPHNGIAISDLTTPPGPPKEFIYPRDLANEFHTKFPDYAFTPKARFVRQDKSGHQPYYQELVKEVSDVIEVTDWVLEKDDWDFIATNFMAIDHVQHFYWHFMEQKNSDYKDAIRDIYQLIDDYLQQIIDQYSNDYQIIISSDHGAGPTKATVYLNLWLHEKGYLYFNRRFTTQVKRIAANLGLNPDILTNIASLVGLTKKAGQVDLEKRNQLVNNLILSYEDIDWQKTRAHAFGMYAGIFLNRSLDKQNRKSITQSILDDLQSDFGKRLTYLDTTDNIYGSNAYSSTVPDIQFLIQDGAVVGTSLYAFAGNKFITKPITHKSAEHRLTGMIAFYPKVEIDQKRLKLIDFSPSILDWYHISPPNYMDGKSWFTEKPGRNYQEVVDIVI